MHYHATMHHDYNHACAGDSPHRVTAGFSAEGNGFQRKRSLIPARRQPRKICKRGQNVAAAPPLRRNVFSPKINQQSSTIQPKSFNKNIFFGKICVFPFSLLYILYVYICIYACIYIYIYVENIQN